MQDACDEIDMNVLNHTLGGGILNFNQDSQYIQTLTQWHTQNPIQNV